MLVRTADIDVTTGRLKKGVPVEPLVLRAKAGDCIQVTLNNKMKGGAIDLDGFNTLPMIVNHFNANQVKPSSEVGLHAQNLFFDVTRSDGVNVGSNPVQTVKPGFSTTYAFTICPRSSSADAITPHSATASCRSSAPSTSGPARL